MRRVSNAMDQVEREILEGTLARARMDYMLMGSSSRLSQAHATIFIRDVQYFISGA